MCYHTVDASIDIQISDAMVRPTLKKFGVDLNALLRTRLRWVLVMPASVPVSKGAIRGKSILAYTATNRTNAKLFDRVPVGAAWESTMYLQEILSSRVYDVAQDTPLELAYSMSNRLGCNV